MAGNHKRIGKSNSTDFARLLLKSGYTLKEFCEFWNIPYRTAQNWRLGLRKPPVYAIRMLEVFIDYKLNNRLQI